MMLRMCSILFYLFFFPSALSSVEYLQTFPQLVTIRYSYMFCVVVETIYKALFWVSNFIV